MGNCSVQTFTQTVADMHGPLLLQMFFGKK